MRKRERFFCYEAGEPSLTKQEFGRDCDINNIVAMYKKGRPMPFTVTPGMFADVSEMGDYKTAVDVLMEAEILWRRLPLEVRQKAGGSPAAFLDYVNDPENAESLVDMGLVTAAPEAKVSQPPKAEKKVVTEKVSEKAPDA